MLNPDKPIHVIYSATKNGYPVVVEKGKFENLYKAVEKMGVKQSMVTQQERCWAHENKSLLFIPATDKDYIMEILSR